MQAKGNRRPRRRPVARHPGIYYRPRPGGKVAPPYEIRYLDSTRQAPLGGRARQPRRSGGEAGRADAAPPPRRTDRAGAGRRSSEYAWDWLERQTGARAHARDATAGRSREHLIPYFGRRRLDQITVDDVAAFIAAMRRKRPARLDHTDRAAAALDASSPTPPAAARSRSTPAASSNAASGRELDDQRPKRILSLEEMQALIASADSEQYRCLLELLLTSGRADRRGARAHRRRPRPRALADPGRVPARPRRHPHPAQDRGVAARDRHPAAADAATARARRRPRRAVRPDRARLRQPKRQRPRAQGRPRGAQARRQGRQAPGTRAEPARPAPQPRQHADRARRPLVDVQRRLGHRKPDTTLRVYAHQWKEREARRSQIGQQLGQLFETRALPPAARETRLALPAATATHEH